MSGIPRDGPLDREPPRTPQQERPARGIRGEKQVEGLAVATHAEGHGAVGEDPVSPGSIGASPLGHGHPPLCTFDATAVPGVNDDESVGYEVGSLWVNVTTDACYQCADATAGAAVWQNISAGAAGAQDVPLLDGDEHNDTAAQAVTKGSLIVGDATPEWNELIVGADGLVLTAQADGTVAWEAAPGAHAEDHKDRHDPEDGADPLDCAAGSVITPDEAAAEGTAHSFSRSDHLHFAECAIAAAIAGVQAGGEGAAYYFARSDHIHAIAHSILDNALATIDGTANAPVLLDYARWTALGLEGRSPAEVLSDISAAAAALSNLAAVAINTSLVSDADAIDDLGATTKRWKDIYFSGDLKDDTTSLSVADLKGPKRTVVLTAQGGKGTVTSGCDGPTQAETGATVKNYWHLSFAANEKAFWQFVMPYNWDGDTVAMTAKFHWLGASGHSASDTVIWGIKAVDIGNDEVMTGAFGTQRTVTDTVITADRLHISGSTALSFFPASPDEGELVILEVERTGGTMTEEALLLAVHITYTTNAYEDWT